MDNAIRVEDGKYIGGMAKFTDSVSVTADGTKTIGQLMDVLFALLNTSKLTKDSVLAANGVYCHIRKASSTEVIFFDIIIGAGTTEILYQYTLKSSGSKLEGSTITASTVTFADSSSWTPTSGTVYGIQY